MGRLAGCVMGAMALGLAGLPAGCVAPPAAGTSSAAVTPAPALDLNDLSNAGEDALARAAAIERDLQDWTRSQESGAPPAAGGPLQSPAHPPRIAWIDPEGEAVEIIEPAPMVDSLADAAKPTAEGDAAPGSNVDHDRPAAPLPADRINELMVDLSRELNLLAADGAHPMRELALITAMTLVRPDRQINADAFPDLTDREREVLAMLQQFFTELGQSFETTPDVDEAVATAIGALRSKLQELHLQVADARLCTRVSGFGDFQEFSRKTDEPYRFLAHSQQQAILYVEVADFSCETNDAGEFITELSQQLVIYSDRDGIPVWTEPWQLAVDRSRNRRRDFFLVQRISLPESLSVGRYQLKVRLRDEQSSAEAERAITFEMVADPRLAGK